jgi:hypothetical protein
LEKALPRMRHLKDSRADWRFLLRPTWQVVASSFNYFFRISCGCTFFIRISKPAAITSLARSQTHLLAVKVEPLREA